MPKVAAEIRLCCCRVLDEQKINIYMFWNRRRWENWKTPWIPAAYSSAKHCAYTLSCCKWDNRSVQVPPFMVVVVVVLAYTFQRNAFAIENNTHTNKIWKVAKHNF